MARRSWSSAMRTTSSSPPGTEIPLEETKGNLGMEGRLDTPDSDRAEAVAGSILNALKG